MPDSIADQLRATNPQFHQSGNHLYIIGGYGRDSAQDKMITFGVLTAVEVSAMIQAVMAGGNIRPFIRQLTDARLQATGGELKKLGEFYEKRFCRFVCRSCWEQTPFLFSIRAFRFMTMK